MACDDCVKFGVIDKGSDGCGSSAVKITDLVVGCEEDVVLTYSPSAADPVCTTGFVSDMVVVVPATIPFYSVEILESDDLDEGNEYAFDRATDVGTDTYTLNPIVKIYNPSHQCMLDSMKGQRIMAIYRLENKSGDFVYRVFRGELTAVSGGLKAGYQLTFDTVDPTELEKPLFVNTGTAETTETDINALTNF